MSGSTIQWKLLLRSDPETVFRHIAAPEGRARFWAAAAPASGDRIHFRFADGTELESRVLESDPPSRYRLTYFDGTEVEFRLEPHRGGTRLTLTESGVPPATLDENRPGWVSVLMNLKAVVDYGVDLRNDEPDADWAAGYVDV